MTGLPRIVPAIVTPFSEGGESVLLDRFPPHLSYLEQRGADGVLALGTNGEGVSLSLQERRDVVDAVLGHRGGLAAFFGTGCASLPETIELSAYAIERGADAVLIVPPFFFKGVDPGGLIDYYGVVMSELPPERKVLLYNIPEVSGVEIGDELVDALVERFPEKLLGVKDTSGSLERTERYVRRYPQLTVYNGSDGNLAEALRLGAHGTISAVGNVFPDLLAGVLRAHAGGEDVTAAQARVDRVRSLLGRYPSHSAVKHLLHLVGGLSLSYVRPPLRDLTVDEAAALGQEVGELAPA